MIVAAQHEHTAVGVGARAVRVPDHIATTIHPRCLAIPDAEDAVVF